jgi:hypothetical protein
MTKNSHDPQQARAIRATGLPGLACLVALAALTVVGCSSTSKPTAVRATSAPTVTVTATPQPAAPAAPVASTAPSDPTVTVTVAPPPTQTVVVQSAFDGPASFRSPSGNINCTLSAPGNEVAARCEVVEHTWTAPPPSDCHLNYGDRFYLTQAGGALVGCYGQELGPGPFPTLEYGQSRSFGTITCNTEYTGMTCTDSITGHYFTVSRDSYELG